MKYKVYNDLIDTITQQSKRLISNVFFGIFISLTGSIVMFILGGKIIDFKNSLCFVIFFITMGYLQYCQVVPNGLIINNTAIEVEILKEEIIVKTSPFKVLFWINRSSVELRFKIDELKARKISYPVKQIFDLDNRVLKLTNNEKEAYIIIDFFDKAFKEKLKEIKLIRG